MFRSKVERALPLSLVAAFSIFGAAGTARAEEPLHHVPSEVCKNCHQEVYRQWSGSMHAQSSALNDPIHLTFYKKVAGSPTEEDVKHKASGNLSRMPAMPRPQCGPRQDHQARRQARLR